MPNLGRYELLGELGHGAMGTVYRAQDPKIGRVVAIKTVRVAGLSDSQAETFRERFFREALAAGRLQHPGIVTIYDVGEDEASRTPYIVMEFVEGQTLDAFVGAHREHSTPGRLDLVRQVAEALDYAHERGIVHRDIKSPNLLVAADERVKITDFGIAKLTGTQYTMTGDLLGTPAYMAPEQFTGGSVDGRSDLFSLGIILYWILTGEKPFAGDSLTQVSFQIAYREAAAVSQRNAQLGGDYDLVLARALAKDPAHRYQRGKEMAADIEDLVAVRPPRSFASRPLPAVAAATERTQAAPAAAVAAAGSAERTVAVPGAAAAERTVAVSANMERTVAAAAPAPADSGGKRRRLALLAALLLGLLGVLGWLWSGRGTTEPAPADAAAQPAGATPAVKRSAPPARPPAARPSGAGTIQRPNARRDDDDNDARGRGKGRGKGKGRGRFKDRD